MKAGPLLTALALLAPVRAAEISTDFKLLPEAGKLQSRAVNEASGLAASPTDPAFLWIINDSGSAPVIHLAGTDGTDRGSLKLTGVKNTDWEDLASFTLGGKPHLLIADTGDNDSKHKTRSLIIVREPALPAAGETLTTSSEPAWVIEYRYEDGPRDCESVAVDESSGKILLISKRTTPPQVYWLPLKRQEKRGLLIAQKLGPTAVKSPAGSIIPFGDQPTGLDITSDGKLAAVVTYHGVFLFPRQTGEDWAEAFARQPTALPAHGLLQAESVAFSKDGKILRTVSEGKNTPIRIYQR
jgi:hypothetical protein